MDDLTILNEIHKGVTTGMSSLEEISKKTSDEEFRSELSTQYNSYQIKHLMKLEKFLMMLLWAKKLWAGQEYK